MLEYVLLGCWLSHEQFVTNPPRSPFGGCLPALSQAQVYGFLRSKQELATLFIWH